MVDLENDVLLTFAEVSKRLPGRPNLSTIHRWRLHGTRGRKLPTLLVGGRRYVRLSDLEAFISSDPTAPASVAPKANSRQRQQALQRADDILAKAGI